MKGQAVKKRRNRKKSMRFASLFAFIVFDSLTLPSHFLDKPKENAYVHRFSTHQLPSRNPAA